MISKATSSTILETKKVDVPITLPNHPVKASKPLKKIQGLSASSADSGPSLASKPVIKSSARTGGEATKQQADHSRKAVPNPTLQKADVRIKRDGAEDPKHLKAATVNGRPMKTAKKLKEHAPASAIVKQKGRVHEQHNIVPIIEAVEYAPPTKRPTSNLPTSDSEDDMVGAEQRTEHAPRYPSTFIAPSHANKMPKVGADIGPQSARTHHVLSQPQIHTVDVVDSAVREREIPAAEHGSFSYQQIDNVLPSEDSATHNQALHFPLVSLASGNATNNNSLPLRHRPVSPGPSRHSPLSSDSQWSDAPQSIMNRGKGRAIPPENSSGSHGSTSSSTNKKRPSIESPVRERVLQTKRNRVVAKENVPMPPAARSEQVRSGASLATAIVIEDEGGYGIQEGRGHGRRRELLDFATSSSTLHIPKRPQKRTSMDFDERPHGNKRLRLQNMDPRRIVSHNIITSTGFASWGRPPKAPQHRPLAMPLTGPIPGEASRQRALERARRIQDRIMREEREKADAPQPSTSHIAASVSSSTFECVPN